jgi:hypothetical protein
MSRCSRRGGESCAVGPALARSVRTRVCKPRNQGRGRHGVANLAVRVGSDCGDEGRSSVFACMAPNDIRRGESGDSFNRHRCSARGWAQVPRSPATTQRGTTSTTTTSSPTTEAPRFALSSLRLCGWSLGAAEWHGGSIGCGGVGRVGRCGGWCAVEGRLGGGGAAEIYSYRIATLSTAR